MAVPAVPRPLKILLIRQNLMLSAADVLKMLVGLKEVGDLDIVSSDAVLSSSCKADDRPTVLAMAQIVDQLLESFDYEKSPEFGEIKGDGSRFSTFQECEHPVLSWLKVMILFK